MKNLSKELVIATCILCIVVVWIVFLNPRSAKEVKIPRVQGDANGFAVVELFTSEGCSSCPPADELVAKLQKDNPLSQLYILGYHIDYWDHQGWNDKFSDPNYSLRQTKYADWFDLRSIYTPQIVVNGKTELVGTDRNALLAAISAGLKQTPANSLTMKCSMEKGRIDLDYQTNAATEQAFLVIALIQRSGQTNVTAGENAGRKLAHVQIVRKLVMETLHSDVGKVSLAIPEDCKSNDLELIGFIQKKTNGTILSVAKYDFVSLAKEADDSHIVAAEAHGP